MRPSAADLERARRWYVQRFGMTTVADDSKIESLAGLLAETRGTVDDLARLQTAALLAVEWSLAVEWHGEERVCRLCRRVGQHFADCRVDAALTAAGLPDQASRDAMRAEIERRDAPAPNPHTIYCVTRRMNGALCDCGLGALIAFYKFRNGARVG